jgi:hypothetical protein
MDDNKYILKVESITLLELFSKDLAIPEYQRPYVWTHNEIYKLLNQFKEHNIREVPVGQKPNFYLGSIVLHNDGKKLNIIDGQQRITTLQLLDVIKNGKNYCLKYTHPITLSNIKKNFDYFKLSDFELIEFKSINVTIVETASEDMAYNFFETLNTGGKKLGGTDILKAHHLRSITENTERNSFALKWEIEQKNLEKVNRMLCMIRRMNYLNKHSFIPDKFTDDTFWKNVLTEDFADKLKKDNRDIGYSFVEIEENTHKITADKYSIRQPLNQGINYINYLLNFTNDYNFLFDVNESRDKKYAEFNKELINVIDGTADLKTYYQLVLLCYVDRFGRRNIINFSVHLFRVIYSLRLNDKSRIYESTVRNFIDETKIMERILNAFTYDEVINFLKNFEVKVNCVNISGVKQRFFERVCAFFIDTTFSKDQYDRDLQIAIENYLKK